MLGECAFDGEQDLTSAKKRGRMDAFKPVRSGTVRDSRRKTSWESFDDNFKDIVVHIAHLESFI